VNSTLIDSVVHQFTYIFFILPISAWEGPISLHMWSM